MSRLISNRMMRGIVVFMVLFCVNFPVNAQISMLNCNYPQNDIPSVTDHIDMSGSEIRIKYGINRVFGGVAVALRLINLAKPTQEVNVLEGRSAAGSGWQWSQLTHSYDHFELMTNQAGGNSFGSQWGYSNTTTGTCSSTNCFINATNWAPLYRDSLRHMGVENPTPQTPCPIAPGVSWAFDEGKFDLAAQPVSIANIGKVVTFSRKYTVRSTTDQYWEHVRSWDAHYFRRKTARDGDLRVFIKGRTDWKVGPIRPYDDWTESGLMDQNGKPRGTMKTRNLPSGWQGSWSEISGDVDHVVLVWNIHGIDVGIVVRNLPDGMTLRLVKNIYCATSDDDECGSIDLIVYHPAKNNVSFPLGSMRTTQIDYYIGSKTQLQAMGYWLQ